MAVAIVENTGLEDGRRQASNRVNPSEARIEFKKRERVSGARKLIF
jgi:hypothetical protein